MISDLSTFLYTLYRNNPPPGQENVSDWLMSDLDHGTSHGCELGLRTTSLRMARCAVLVLFACALAIQNIDGESCEPEPSEPRCRIVCKESEEKVCAQTYMKSF